MQPYLWQFLALTFADNRSREAQPAKAKRAVRKRWAELIYKIYHVDPLTCRCGAQMKVVAFVTDPASIRRILANRNKNPS